MSTPGRSVIPRSSQRTIIIIFVVMLLMPLAGQLVGFTGLGFIEQVEFRSPAPPPQWPESLAEWEDLPDQIESYVNDHFGFRSALSTLNSWMLALIGSSGSDRIVVGRSGWLFFNNGRNIDDIRGATHVDNAELEAWVEAMRDRQRLVRGFGAHMVVAIFPSKKTIYPEFLPAWARPVGPSRLDLLMKEIEAAGDLDVIDTRPALLAAKKRNDRPLYYLTDTHWNPEGAFVAYSALIGELTARFSGIDPVTPDEVDVEQEAYPSPAGLKRIHNVAWGWDEPAVSVVRVVDPKPILSSLVLEDGRWRRCNASEVRANMWRPAVVRTALEGGGVRALIFRDSFTNLLLPFFNQSFQTVLYAHHDRNTFDEGLARAFAPDLVLYNLFEDALVFPPRTRSEGDALSLPANSTEKLRGDAGWSPSSQRLQFGHVPVPWIDETGFYASHEIQNGRARWTSGAARLTVPFAGGERPRKLEVSLVSWRRHRAGVEIRIDGQIVLRDAIAGGPWTRTIPLTHLDLGDSMTIEILSDTFVPARLDPESSDARTLGVCVLGMWLFG